MRTIRTKTFCQLFTHESVRGTNGGYRLAQPPASITIREIVEALEGELRATDLDEGGQFEEIIRQGVYSEQEIERLRQSAGRYVENFKRFKRDLRRQD